MPSPQGRIQIGKYGVTENFLQTLATYFKKYKTVKISVLKSAGHTKEKVKEIEKEIIEFLGTGFRSRVLGFVIVLQRRN